MITAGSLDVLSRATSARSRRTARVIRSFRADDGDAVARLLAEDDPRGRHRRRHPPLGDEPARARASRRLGRRGGAGRRGWARARLRWATSAEGGRGDGFVSPQKRRRQGWARRSTGRTHTCSRPGPASSSRGRTTMKAETSSEDAASAGFGRGLLRLELASADLAASRASGRRRRPKGTSLFRWRRLPTARGSRGRRRGDLGRPRHLPGGRLQARGLARRDVRAPAADARGASSSRPAGRSPMRSSTSTLLAHRGERHDRHAPRSPPPGSRPSREAGQPRVGQVRGLRADHRGATRTTPGCST